MFLPALALYIRSISSFVRIRRFCSYHESYYGRHVGIAADSLKLNSQPRRMFDYVTKNGFFFNRTCSNATSTFC